MTPDTRDLKLHVLSSICEIIAHLPDLENILLEVLRIMSDNLSMKRATVTLLDRKTGMLFITASHGLTPEEMRRGVYRLDEGVTGRIFQTGKPYAVPDIRNEPLFLNKTQSRTLEKQHLTFIGVPITLQGIPIGVLNVDRLFGDHVSTQEDIEFLQVVAVLIAQFVSLNEQFQNLRAENASLRYKVSKGTDGPYIVGRSSAMQEVQRQIERVAPTRATVLLQGESGTGKTLIGRIIHDLSERKKFPFIKVNCASIPENLLESELFGYEKGAFTGAMGAKPGKFEEADNGSIFLDEIGELPLGLQAKLLRFIQEKEFERLGSNKTRRVDVRILAATNKDLEALSNQGAFRPDLFYRLNVFPIHTPALRERKEDIEGLLIHFLRKVSREYNREIHFSIEALELLKAHDWPGNVREMENLIERLVILSEQDRIQPELIEPFLGSRSPMRTDSHSAPEPAKGEDKPALLREMEKREIIAALGRNGWVQARAAKELGLSQRQMGYKISKFDLDAMVSVQRVRSRKKKYE
ncbi:sigma 54-interacting transcriptional regulator [Desulfonatronum parangueonense]